MKTNKEVFSHTLVRTATRMISGELYLSHPTEKKSSGTSVIFSCDLETLPFGVRERLELGLCNEAGDQSLTLLSSLERAYFLRGKWWLHFRLNPEEFAEIQKLA